MKYDRPTNQQLDRLITPARVSFLIGELMDSCVVEEVLEDFHLPRADRRDFEKRRLYHDWADNSTEAEAEKDRIALLVGKKVMAELRRRDAQWEWYTVPVEQTKS